jgi:hypothetical protein
MKRILGMSATAVLPAAVAMRAGVAATVTGAASTRSYGGTAAPAPVVIQATGGENLRIIRGVTRLFVDISLDSPCQPGSHQAA